MKAEEGSDLKARQSTRLLRANSIDVDARLTPLDPPGKPAAPTEPGSPVLRMAPACGTIAFLKSDRPADPTAGERNGD